MTLGKVKAFTTALYNRKSIKQVTDLIRMEAPDIVHIHNLYPLISPAILPQIKKTGIPIVMTIHNYRLVCPNGLFYTKGAICEKCTGMAKEFHCITNNCEGSIFKSTGYALRNFWARKKKYYIDHVDAFLCLTQFQKNKMTINGYPVYKCKVLPSFYSKEIKGIEYDIQNRKYVAFVGRISPEKGIPLLLQVARNLPEIAFQIAGNARPDYLDQLNIPKNVIFKGMLNAENLTTLYSNARFLVMTSSCYEGFPMVLLEAMAHKLPVIVPNLAGNPEILEENVNGLLFQPGSERSLIAVIKKLWNDQELSKKLSKKSVEKIQNKFGTKLYVNKLEKVYDQLLEK
jgi:glycosyltransferase involved in cell wall biosynthesis